MCVCMYLRGVHGYDASYPSELVTQPTHHRSAVGAASTSSPSFIFILKEIGVAGTAAVVHESREEDT